jgi:hypothetical protein
MTPKPEITDSELAQNVYNLLRGGIEEIADPEYQARVWLGDLPDEKSCYLDASSEVLDQPERFELMASYLGDIGLDQRRWARVVEFARALQAFEDSVAHPYDDAEVMGHPSWSAIVDRARALLPELPKGD